jgi:chemotaxis protein methyltransferase CheR
VDALESSPEVRDLTREEYQLFRKLIYEKVGINLGDQKMQLVRARLGKRLRQGKFNSFRAYYEYLRNDKSGAELTRFIDALSTNTTHLFREMQHFEFLAERLKKWAGDRSWCGKNQSEVRIWSAACSSGEEPHSIAMTCADALANSGVSSRILATDISTQVLDRARQGIYDPLRLGTVPEGYRRRFFHNTRVGGRELVQIKPEVRSSITFARLNLMEKSFPFRRGFHFIFCRNVMIYFDRETQTALVNKQAQHLLPGGFLLIGHSESLNAIQHPLTYVRPTIYERG